MSGVDISLGLQPGPRGRLVWLQMPQEPVAALLTRRCCRR